MTLVLNGTTGVSAVDGSAATPAIQGNDSNTGVFFPAADTVAIATGGTERVRVDASGNLGLGVTPSASNTVTVFQNKNTSYSALNENLYLSANGFFATGWKYITAGAATQYRQTAGEHQWWNAPSGTAGNAISFTQAMTLDASGKLLVNATTSAEANGGRFGVRGTVNETLITIYTAGTGNTTGSNIIFGDDNNVTFRVYSNGNTQNRNNSYGAVSDAKLKENIVDATPKLEKLNQVRVVNYNLIGQEQKQIGVIAQELQEIFPGMIDDTPDLDAEGNDLGTTTKSVKYSVFVPMLIKAMQEQQAQIEALKARLDALDGPSSAA